MFCYFLFVVAELNEISIIIAVVITIVIVNDVA